MAKDEAPSWRANETSHIGHALVEEGATVNYTPPTENSEVGANLSPLNAAAQAIVDGQKGPHPDKKAGASSKEPKAPKAAKGAKDALGVADEGNGATEVADSPEDVA